MRTEVLADLLGSKVAGGFIAEMGEMGDLRGAGEGRVGAGV